MQPIALARIQTSIRMARPHFQWIVSLLMFYAALSNPLYAAAEGDAAPLSTQDISKVLRSIFNEHLNHKKMDTDVMKRSIQLFINQFDPDRSYLLAGEVSRFQNLSSQKLTRLVQDFDKMNYSYFHEMQEQFCKAILRARDMRKKFNFSGLKSMDYELDKSSQEIVLNELSPFPQQLDDLEARQRVRILRLLQQKAKASPNMPFQQILNEVMKDIEEFENSYLGVDIEGKPLLPKAKEDLFSFHVLKAVVASLDAHSSFLEPKEAKLLKMQLQMGFDGIGVELEMKSGHVIITKMIPGAAAEKSGQLQAGDELLSIEGAPIAGKSLDDVVTGLQGKAGTTVSFQIKRMVGGEARTLKVALSRQRVVEETGRVDVSFEKIQGGIIGKITLHAFYEGNGISAVDDVRNAIRTLKKEGPLKGLILDLRDNRGGFLMQAVKVAGLFIKTGVVVIAKTQDGQEHFYRDIDATDEYDGPLIVLTSKLTASAAEIVAQALKDYGVALIVGDSKTYGKGSIQTQTVTSGRADPALKVTIGQYYSVSGESTQLEGVKADIVVPSVFFDSKLGEEYLNFPIKEDAIAPAFDDKLADIPADSKEWYLKYYLPNLQKRQLFPKKKLEALRQKSSQRLTSNEEYQKFLTNPPASIASLKSAETADQQHIWDLQMQEAVNIIKDMNDAKG